MDPEINFFTAFSSSGSPPTPKKKTSTGISKMIHIASWEFLSDSQATIISVPSVCVSVCVSEEHFQINSLKQPKTKKPEIMLWDTLGKHIISHSNSGHRAYASYYYYYFVNRRGERRGCIRQQRLYHPPPPPPLSPFPTLALPKKQGPSKGHREPTATSTPWRDGWMMSGRESLFHPVLLTNLNG